MLWRPNYTAATPSSAPFVKRNTPPSTDEFTFSRISLVNYKEGKNVCSLAHGWVRVVGNGGVRLNTQECACRWGASKRVCSCGRKWESACHAWKEPSSFIDTEGPVCVSAPTALLSCLSPQRRLHLIFFHTVQPEVCLSADKEFLYTSIVFFNNPPAPQTSPLFSFYGCPEDWKENLQLAAHQHAKHGTALDLAKWINLDLGCKWAHKCVIANSWGHAEGLVPFSSLLATAAAMFLLRNEVTQVTFTEVSLLSVCIKKKKKNSWLLKKVPLFLRYNSSHGTMESASCLQPCTITMAIYLHLLPFHWWSATSMSFD